jgi:hypothetical protein
VPLDERLANSTGEDQSDAKPPRIPNPSPSAAAQFGYVGFGGAHPEQAPGHAGAVVDQPVETSASRAIRVYQSTLRLGGLFIPLAVSDELSCLRCHSRLHVDAVRRYVVAMGAYRIRTVAQVDRLVSKTLLVVHHTPSPTTRELLEAVVAGTNDPEIAGGDVVCRPALAATLPDMLDADGYLFGTTTNFG